MTYLPHHFPFSIWKNFERYEVLTGVLPKVRVSFKSSGIRRGVKLLIHTYVSGAESFSETSVSHKTVTFTQELICLAFHYSSPRSHQDVFDFNIPISLLILCFRDKWNPTFPWFPYLGWRKKWFFAGINRYLYKQGILTYQYRPHIGHIARPKTAYKTSCIQQTFITCGDWLRRPNGVIFIYRPLACFRRQCRWMWHKAKESAVLMF